MDFNAIMTGFVQAQIAANKRGDFSPDAGVEYLNGVAAALESLLSPPAEKPPLPNTAWDTFKVFNAGREAQALQSESNVSHT